MSRRGLASPISGMSPGPGNPIVHLELHTGAPQEAAQLYAALCGWRPLEIRTRFGSYLALEGTGELGAGLVQCRAPRALWLPYVEVPEIEQATARARELGASVLLEPREGPAGWRSVLATPAAGEIALWQPKR
jgi:predicted enzyme related to lactoylglutathione lyase